MTDNANKIWTWVTDPISYTINELNAIWLNFLVTNILNFTRFICKATVTATNIYKYTLVAGAISPRNKDDNNNSINKYRYAVRLENGKWKKVHLRKNPKRLIGYKDFGILKKNKNIIRNYQ